MKITRAQESKQINIETENDGDYVRYSAGSWYKWYGESLEAEYHCERELEAEYQAWLEEKEA